MKYLDKAIVYGLYLLVFFLPLQTRWIIKPGELNGGPWEYGTYSLYAIDILLIVILSLFVIYRFLSVPNDQTPMTNDQTNSKLPGIMFRTIKIQNLLILGLVLAAAISVFFAIDRPLALYKFGWLILGLGLFWLIASANYDKTKLIYALSVGAFLQAGLGIWQFLTQAAFANKWLGLATHRGVDLGASVVLAVGADGVGERWLRAYGGLDHPNILGGMLAIVILLLISEKLWENYSDKITSSKTLYFFWASLIFFTAGLFFSFSRSAWLALSAGLVMMIISAVARGNLKSQKGLAEIILVMGILALVLFSQYQNLITTRLNGEGRLETKSNSERLASCKQAWQIIKNNWLPGAGLGNYTLASRRALPEQGSYFYQPAHNVFLLVWAEIGIFGLIFFIGLLFIMAMNRRKNILSDSQGSNLDCSSVLTSAQKKKTECLRGNDNQAVILIALVVIMLFDHWLFSLHFGVLFFWLVLGLTSRNS